MKVILLVVILMFSGVAGEKRINQNGRELPELPQPPKEAVLFDTPEADKILSALQIMPVDSPYNEDYSGRPVLANSDAMIANMGADITLKYNQDMCFVIVPPDQKRINVPLQWPDASEPGPYPVPDNTPIEGFPVYVTGKEDGTRAEKLDYIQKTGNGDRHALVLDPWNNMLYEFYQMRKTDNGWVAMNEATFDLTSNKARKNGRTSSDAAGFPVMPLSVRYDEVARGMVEHITRVTFKEIQKSFVWPASHTDGRAGNKKDYPRMGERLRLKKEFDITTFSPHIQAMLAGFKKYGLIVADTGGSWRISVCPDSRIQNLEELARVKGSDFEFVTPTSKSAGPRAKKGE